MDRSSRIRGIILRHHGLSTHHDNDVAVHPYRLSLAHEGRIRKRARPDRAFARFHDLVEGVIDDEIWCPQLLNRRKVALQNGFCLSAVKVPG